MDYIRFTVVFLFSISGVWVCVCMCTLTVIVFFTLLNVCGKGFSLHIASGSHQQILCQFEKASSKELYKEINFHLREKALPQILVIDLKTNRCKLLLRFFMFLLFRYSGINEILFFFSLPNSGKLTFWAPPLLTQQWSFVSSSQLKSLAHKQPRLFIPSAILLMQDWSQNSCLHRDVLTQIHSG